MRTIAFVGSIDFVMAGLVPAIHEHSANIALMDGRHEGGHDGRGMAERI